MSTPPPIDHYENFPVASWLCPPALRPAVAAIYHFARTADDLADEGSASTAERLRQLAQYRADLIALRDGRALTSPWAHTIAALRAPTYQHQLSWDHFLALLDAFEQDVRYTHSGQRYEDWDDLLAYCAKSANPVGRLMLRLLNADSPSNTSASDHICTALQLINFWQDFSVDLPRGRDYIPVSVWRAHKLPEDSDLRTLPEHQARAVVQALVARTRARMHLGAGLPPRIAGRMGWELRAVVQGGLRVLEKIQALDYASWRARPQLSRADQVLIAWRCLWMSPKDSRPEPPSRAQ
jgi:hydroxysqualene synthase